MSKPRDYVQLELFDFDKLIKNTDETLEFQPSFDFDDIEFEFTAEYDNWDGWEDSDWAVDITDADHDSFINALSVDKYESPEVIAFNNLTPSNESAILKNELAELTKTLYAQYARVKDLTEEIQNLQDQLSKNKRKE